MPRLFAIDSMAILYRSYFAMIRNPLINSQGINTSGVFGLLSQIIKIAEMNELEYLAIASDLPNPTFRHKQFPAYKATREKMPEDLVEQLPYLPRLMEALNLPYLTLPGYEADDIIGTLMLLCQQWGIEGVMVTSDKDYMQLVSDHIVMLNHKGETIDTQKVYERFGCTPGQVIEILGLMGDSSDNIPGVAGVGEKTAIKLIQQYENIVNLYDHLDEISGKKLKENLVAGQENAILSRKLVTIDRHVPIPLELESLRFKKDELYHNSRFHDFLEELEFKSFLKRFKPQTSSAPKPITLAKNHFILIDSMSSFRKLIVELQQVNQLAFDIMATGKHAIDDRLTHLAFCAEPKTAYYLPLQNQEWISHEEEIHQLLKEVFENPDLLFIGHDLKLSIQLLQRQGIHIQGKIFDTQIAAQMLETERNYSLNHLVSLKLKQAKQFEIEGSGKVQQLSMLDLEDKETQNYLCENAELILQLYHVLQSQLAQTDMLRSFKEIEMPLVLVLVELELTGIYFDLERIVHIAEDFTRQLEHLSKEIYKLAGETFNINSVVELQKVLYDKLELHKACNIRPKKIKLGNQMSTGEETLEKMSAFPLAQNILKYRAFNKLKNTYIDQLPSFVNQTTHRIHSSFRQAVTATGRLASDNPNLQNIPIRTPEGRRIRELFIPSTPDHTLIAADYSQIELRIVAHYSKDPTFLEAYRNNLDIHALTASTIFNVDPEEVTREMRAKAKEVNFGLIYRMGPDRLAIVTQTAKKDAKRFIEKFFQKYATIHALQERFLEQARKEGYAVTLQGRRRYLTEINGKGLAKQMAEGAAINTPIQGSAAEIIKMAMIRINQKLNTEKLESKMILSVHDELVFDALKEEQDLLCQLVKEEMEHVITLEVPLVVEIGTGHNWLEAH
ncbi:MAG: DNA polymerase I [SAR324 cluster bacterium]|nr:DNA polymerase I [SAR324 cluster bacterium]